MKTVTSVAAALVLSCLTVAKPAAAAPEASVTSLVKEALPEYL
ncbi:hypothetical protein [Cupriavidus necator]